MSIISEHGPHLTSNEKQYNPKPIFFGITTFIFTVPSLFSSLGSMSIHPATVRTVLFVSMIHLKMMTNIFRNSIRMNRPFPHTIAPYRKHCINITPLHITVHIFPIAHNPDGIISFIVQYLISFLFSFFYIIPRKTPFQKSTKKNYSRFPPSKTTQFCVVLVDYCDRMSHHPFSILWWPHNVYKKLIFEKCSSAYFLLCKLNCSCRQCKYYFVMVTLSTRGARRV